MLMNFIQFGCAMFGLIWSYLNLLSLIGLSTGLFYYYMKYQHTYWERRGIRTLPGHWLFGNFKDGILMRLQAGVLLGQLHQQANDDDDVLGIYILNKPFLLVRNPEMIKQVLIKDFNVFPDRYFSADSIKDKLGSMNLFTIRNPLWKHLRVKMTPVFTSGKLKSLFHLMVESGGFLKEYLQNEFEDGSKTKTINAKEIMMRYTNDVISTVAFGVRTNSFTNPVPEFYEKSKEGTAITLLRGARLLFMFFFPTLAKYVADKLLGSATDYFRKVFWNSMDTREATKTKRGDLIDSLLELKNEKQSGDLKMEDDVLLAQSAIFFIAGRESSVATTTFTLYELAKQPEVQERVRLEILEKLKAHGMTYQAVQEMKYLNQVISETLRMYPAAPILDRLASTDYKIPGSDVVIERGTPIYVSLVGLHYDPRYHAEPKRFDPDRFSDERKKEITQCTYMPFGEGPRSCIASRLGLLQSTIGLINVLSDYKVSLCPEYNADVIDVRNVFMAPSDGLKLNFSKVS